MAIVRPIRKSEAQPLDRTGDATGFRCEQHESFKVADTVFFEEHKNATREQWRLH